MTLATQDWIKSTIRDIQEGDEVTFLPGNGSYYIVGEVRDGTHRKATFVGSKGHRSASAVRVSKPNDPVYIKPRPEWRLTTFSEVREGDEFTFLLPVGTFGFYRALGPNRGVETKCEYVLEEGPSPSSMATGLTDDFPTYIRRTNTKENSTTMSTVNEFELTLEDSAGDNLYFEVNDEGRLTVEGSGSDVTDWYFEREDAERLRDALNEALPTESAPSTAYRTTEPNEALLRVAAEHGLRAKFSYRGEGDITPRVRRVEVEWFENGLVGGESWDETYVPEGYRQFRLDRIQGDVVVAR